MGYVATTKIHWHVTADYSDAGDKVPQSLLDENQSAEDVAALVKKGVLVTEEQWAAAVKKLETDKAKAAAELDELLSAHREKFGPAAAA